MVITFDKGGLGDVYVDGVLRGRIGFYNATNDFGRFALNNLSSGLHKVEIRGVLGNIYFDGALVDGKLFASNTRLSFIDQLGGSGAELTS